MRYEDKRKKSTSQPPSGNKAQRWNDTQFIQYELTAEQRALCKAWCSEPDAMDTLLYELCGDGYKFSVKWDDYSSSYAAYVTALDPKSVNGGFMLTGRGSTPLKAIKQAAFKHFQVFDRDWSQYAEKKAPIEIDD